MVSHKEWTDSRLERYAWTVMLCVSAVFFLFGLTDFFAGGSTFGQGEAATFQGISGTTWQSTKASPVASQIDWMVRSQAIWMMVAGSLFGIISASAFRRGERWAWFAMLVFPVAIVALDLNLVLSLTHPSGGRPAPLVSGPLLGGLWVATLAVTFRRAFRRSRTDVR